MEYVETYTNIPTILSIKINENVGYINAVYFLINGCNLGKLDWVDSIAFPDDPEKKYSLFSTQYIFNTKCQNQTLQFVYEVGGNSFTTAPIVFNVENFYDG